MRCDLFTSRAKPHGPIRHSGASNPSHPNRRGAVIVELAVIAPFLLTLILGMCEVAQSLRAEALLTQAARKGCAAASRPGCTNSDVIYDVKKALVDAGLSDKGLNVKILVNDQPGKVGAARAKDKVTVFVEYPTSQATFTGTSIFMGAKTLQSEAMSMLRQG